MRKQTHYFLLKWTITAMRGWGHLKLAGQHASIKNDHGVCSRSYAVVGDSRSALGQGLRMVHVSEAPRPGSTTTTYPITWYGHVWRTKGAVIHSYLMSSIDMQNVCTARFPLLFQACLWRDLGGRYSMLGARYARRDTVPGRAVGAGIPTASTGSL